MTRIRRMVQISEWRRDHGREITLLRLFQQRWEISHFSGALSWGAALVPSRDEVLDNSDLKLR
jgi:hypothetical protein